MSPPDHVAACAETATHPRSISRGTRFGGLERGLPRSDELPLIAKEKLTAAFQVEWAKLAHAAREDVVAQYGSAKALAEMYEYAEAQISRVLDGLAHPPGWLLALIIWRCKERHFLRAASDLASCDLVPRPDPTEAEEALAMLHAAREHGAEPMLRAWANLPPREDAP